MNESPELEAAAAPAAAAPAADPHAAEALGSFAALEANLPAELAPGAPAAPPPAPVDWNIAAAGVVSLVATVVAPNWELTADEQDALRRPLVTVLEQFFPAVELEPKWQAVAALVLAAGAIAATRFDPGTGLRPLRRPAPVSSGAGAARAAGGLDGMNLGPAAA